MIIFNEIKGKDQDESGMPEPIIFEEFKAACITHKPNCINLSVYQDIDEIIELAFRNICESCVVEEDLIKGLGN